MHSPLTTYNLNHHFLCIFFSFKIPTLQFSHFLKKILSFSIRANYGRIFNSSLSYASFLSFQCYLFYLFPHLHISLVHSELISDGRLSDLRLIFVGVSTKSAVKNLVSDWSTMPCPLKIQQSNGLCRRSKKSSESVDFVAKLTMIWNFALTVMLFVRCLCR